MGSEEELLGEELLADSVDDLRVSIVSTGRSHCNIWDSYMALMASELEIGELVLETLFSTINIPATRFAPAGTAVCLPRLRQQPGIAR